MARIAGVNLPTNKRVIIALTYIHGIGRTRAVEIADKLKLIIAAVCRILPIRKYCRFAKPLMQIIPLKAIFAVKRL